MSRLCFLLLVLVCDIQLKAQCPTVTPDPVGACTGTPLTDNANINPGDTAVFTGGPTTFNNVSLNGGMLKICGALTVNSFNFNSGKLIIGPTGSLNFTPSATTLAARNLINYGSVVINSLFDISDSTVLANLGVLTFTVSTSETGPEATIYNAPGAVINMLGLSANISNTFINYGTAVFDNFTIQGSATVCLGPGSSIQTVNLNNNVANATNAVLGSACISYSGTALMNQPLTTTSAVIVCNRSGVPASGNFGSATVVDNCTSCQVVLPVRLSSFTALAAGNDVTLHWTSETEDNLASYVIEKSTGPNAFVNIGEVNALNRPSSSYNFPTTIHERSYFRLKMVDKDGQYYYSKVLVVKPTTGSPGFALLTNPVLDGTARILIHSSGQSEGAFLLHDIAGRLMKKVSVHLSNGNNFINVPVDELIAGIYTIQYSDAGRQSAALRLIKLY